MPGRLNKLKSAQEALASVRDASTLIIGGSLFHNKPMHLVRQIVRQGARGLTVIAVPQASMDVDLLIGGGCVRQIRVPYLGFEYLGLAPNYRRLVQERAIEVWDCDETQLLTGLEAASKNLPSGLVKTGVGTDLPAINPDLRQIEDPVSGEPIIAVGAIRPDVAIIHATWGDIHGNLRYAGYSFGDLLIAEATRRGGGTVIASVDEIVPTARFDADPFRTDIAGFLVDAVVEAPYGAHPCSSHGHYQFDEEHLVRYLNASREGAQGIAAYIAEHVHGAESQCDYLDRFLRPSRLVDLRKEIHVQP